MAITPLPLSDSFLGPEFPLPLDEPFTAARARTADITRSRLARLLHIGLIRRVLKGVYVASQVPDTMRVRLQAVSLVASPGAVVTDWTATWLYTGLLPFGGHVDVPPISLFRLPGHGRVRYSQCQSGERDLRPWDVQVFDGVAMTTPICTAWDIGRLSRRDVAIGGLDGLLRHTDLDKEEMVNGVERFRRHRGVVQLRGLAPLADGRSESPGESVLRLRWLDLPMLPPPVPQVPVLDSRGREIYRLDLGVEELHYAAEYDGESFHTEETDRTHDAERRTWIVQKRHWSIDVARRVNVFGPQRDIEAILMDGVREARRTYGRRQTFF
ncbi:MAG: hypothetical protein H0V42_06560 [Nocardioidaceae bacterium]|nr:hypothetical protein [Nocardioidaceae bacterium]